MDKTVMVRIDRQVRHALYGKTVRRSSKLAAHDEANDAHVGDTVRVVETRPLSKSKRWRVVEIVERHPSGRFVVLPKRWIVERTLGWLMKQRRLRCDYEQLIATSETMIHVAMIRLMLRRLHP